MGSIRRLGVGLLVLALLAVSVSPVLADQPVKAAEPTRICFGSGCWWMAGANLPWVNYGHDFGWANWPTGSWSHDGVSSPTTRARADSYLAFLAIHGVKFVRWFVFADGRASPEFDSYGYVTGLDGFFFADMDAALALAEKHDLYFILVLLDYHWIDSPQIVNGVQLGGHKAVINDQNLRQSLLDKALLPVLRRYGRNPRIVWEVINEPEWRVSGIPGLIPYDQSVPLERMQSFVQVVTACIHRETSQKVTLGSAKSSWLPYWQRYWFGSIGLDFYQAHHYSWMGQTEAPFIPVASLDLDRPVLVGEFPTKDSSHAITQYLDASWNNGYCGSLAWSLNGNDEFSDFRSVANEFLEWVASHPIQAPWSYRLFLPIVRRQ